VTHEKLKEIEANLRRVEKLWPGDYGLVTALELVEELRKLLPVTRDSAVLDGASQSQFPVSGAPE
jgi:hypothetical protein